MKTFLLIGLISSVIGYGGYKIYDEYEKDKEFDKLYESFIEYNKNLESREIFYKQNKDPYSDFKVVHFESIYDYNSDEDD